MLDRLNSGLAREFGHALDYTICLHTGHAAVAEIGVHGASQLAAAGEAIDDGVGLRRLSAETGSRVIVSQAFLRHVGTDAAAFQRHEVASGGAGPMLVAYPLSSVSAIEVHNVHATSSSRDERPRSSV